MKAPATDSGGRAADDSTGAGTRGGPPDLPEGAATGSVAERIVGVVQGDRACHACGFDLRGQPIVREAHYSMLLLRCPECGCVGPVAEYPIASTFAKRVGRLLAIAWLLGVIAVYLVIALMTATLAQSSATRALEPVALVIAENFIAYAKEEVAKNPNAATNANQNWTTWAASQVPSAAIWIDPVWWQRESGRSWVDDAMALHAPFTRAGLLGVLRSCALLIPAGMVLACIFPHRRGAALGVIALGVIPLGVLIAWAMAGPSTIYWGGYGNIMIATNAAHEAVGLVATATQIGMIAPALVVGVLVGRRVARWTVVWLLPPRLRVAYAFLWIADGKPMPKPEKA